MPRPRDEEEAEVVVEKKRRRPKKQPVEDAEEDARGKKPGKDRDEEEEEINSLSTGNVFLDILLDFRDDCLDWAKAHLLISLVFGILSFVISLTCLGLTIRYIVNYLNRPTLAQALSAYDFGSYPEAKRFANGLLQTISPDDVVNRSGALFVLGAATCSIAEIARNTDRQPYYLAAADYLKESSRYGFVAHRQTEGFFLLGKSLYLSGQLGECREPLLEALERGSENTKWIEWFLANSYFLDSEPNYKESLRFVRRFQRNPIVTEEEGYEADLLQTLILLQLDDIEGAEKIFLRVPIFDRFETMREFASGQIAFCKARKLRQQAIKLEESHHPEHFDETVPVAPIPITPNRISPDGADDAGKEENVSPHDPFRESQQKELLPGLPKPTTVEPTSPASPSTREPDPSTSDQPLLPTSPERKALIDPFLAPVPETPSVPMSRTAPVADPAPFPNEFGLTLQSPKNSASDPGSTVSNALGSSSSNFSDPGRSAIVQAPAPVVYAFEAESKDKPLFQRMLWMRADDESQPSSEPTVVPATPSVPPETQPISSSAGTGHPTVSQADPDGVIVLPTEEDHGPHTAPLPKKLPQTPAFSPIPSDPRLKRAQWLYQQANEYYRAAIDHFRQVRRNDQFASRWLRQAELLEGISFEEMNELQKAQEVYLHLVEAYPLTSEAVAARFFWAEIERNSGHAETALAGYAQAFDSMNKGGPYSCFWLPVATILDRCSEMVRQNVTMKEYVQALTLLFHLKGIMSDAELARNKAEIYRSWAEDLRRQASASFREREETLRKESWEKYRLAGEAYDEFAQRIFHTGQYDENLWNSAECFRLGRDYRRGIVEYKRFLRANNKEHQVEARLYLGESYLHLDGLDEAAKYLEDVLEEYPDHALVPRVRLVLSNVCFEKKEFGKARTLLEQNMIGDYAPSSSIYRDSMYALAKLDYEQGNLIEAIPLLEDALKIHPHAIQSVDAHYALGQAYLKRSEEALKMRGEAPLETTKRKIEADALEDRVKALDHIRKTEELLVKRQDAIGLSEAEQLMLRNVLFQSGSILMQLKRYEEAIPMFDVAATRYQNNPAALDALIQIVVAYRYLQRPEDALPILNRAELLLKQLEKNNEIPKENNWAEQIRVQRNLILETREIKQETP